MLDFLVRRVNQSLKGNPFGVTFLDFRFDPAWVPPFSPFLFFLFFAPLDDAECKSSFLQRAKIFLIAFTHIHLLITFPRDGFLVSPKKMTVMCCSCPPALVLQHIFHRLCKYLGFSLHARKLQVETGQVRKSVPPLKQQSCRIVMCISQVIPSHNDPKAQGQIRMSKKCTMKIDYVQPD